MGVVVRRTRGYRVAPGATGSLAGEARLTARAWVRIVDLGRWASWLLITALAGGCTTSTPSVSTSQPSTSSHALSVDGRRCHETIPVTHGVPAVLADAEADWYGRGHIWVNLWWTDSGISDRNFGPNDDKEYPYAVKYGSVIVEHGRLTDSFGHPHISVRRLDGTGRSRASFGAYASAGGVDFWPTGVGFSRRGCWEVTESVAGSTIKFVLKV